MQYERISTGKARDLTEEAFGRWTPLWRVKSESKRKHVMWLCRCVCGTEKVVYADNLGKGGSTSCGCYQREVTKTHNTVHGNCKTPEYISWSGMRNRCNRHAKWYEGVTYHKPWDVFSVFLNYMGKQPPDHPDEGPYNTIDRIDTKGHYVPGNVRWATRTTQQNNTRRTRNITYKGVDKSIAMWAREKGIDYPALRYMICTKKWSGDKAIGHLLDK